MLRPKIAIVDYGVGNLRSIHKALETLGAIPEITKDRRVIQRSDAVVLPGVGAFGDAISELKKISGAIYGAVDAGIPLLGVCLGMQLLMSQSEEDGPIEGLNLISGDVVKLPNTVKIPHMGWNSIKIKRPSPLMKGVKDGDFVYFVHSYYANVRNPNTVIATTEYGTEFSAVISKGDVFGTQFHPEKSGDVGLRILRNFISIVVQSI